MEVLLRCNPICQVVDRFGRCTQPAKVGHHLVPPEVDYSRFYDWRNIVCICQHHHGHGEGEDPDAARNFVPTNWVIGTVREAQEHPQKDVSQTALDANGLIRQDPAIAEIERQAALKKKQASGTPDTEPSTPESQ